MLSHFSIKAFEDLASNFSKSNIRHWITELTFRIKDLEENTTICHSSLSLENPCKQCMEYHLDTSIKSYLEEILSRNV